MKIKFITADGCERHEERAFEGDRPDREIRLAFTPRMLLTPYPQALQNNPLPVFYRVYELITIDQVTTGVYSAKEVAVYVEKL